MFFSVKSFIDTDLVQVDYDPQGGNVSNDTEITAAGDGARTRDGSPFNYIYNNELPRRKQRGICSRKLIPSPQGAGN